MSEISGAWYHCTRCGSLFKAAADAELRGACPDCGEDPAGEVATPAPGPVKVRRKIRKKQPTRSSSRGEGRRKARALMIFVMAWVFVLGAGAIVMKRNWPDKGLPEDDAAVMSPEEIEDSRLIRDHLEACSKRLMEFLAAPDVGARALHVIGGGRTVQRMARVQQFNPMYPTSETARIEKYGVIRTPAGRAIETLWVLGEDKRIEAVFFEEEGEWKIDWDAYARAGAESWPLFLAGRGEGKGEFRLLARERIGAGGRDPEFIGLVLYGTRLGEPGEAIAPSPEVKVERNSPMGRQIEEAFEARRNGVAPFGSKLTAEDPDEMIRLRVRVSREGENERVFRIEELFACHWLSLPSAPEGED